MLDLKTQVAILTAVSAVTGLAYRKEIAKVKAKVYLRRKLMTAIFLVLD